MRNAPNEALGFEFDDECAPPTRKQKQNTDEDESSAENPQAGRKQNARVKSKAAAKAEANRQAAKDAAKDQQALKKRNAQIHSLASKAVSILTLFKTDVDALAKNKLYAAAPEFLQKKAQELSGSGKPTSCFEYHGRQ